MSKQGLISVIIPVYNVEKYLSKCLDSIINNTYQNLEIICVNDGSTDGSLAILEKYAVIENRIKVLSQENQGQSTARNVGIENSHGEFIAFVDSDDYIHKQYFEILLKPMLTADVSVSAAKYKQVTMSDETDCAYGEIDYTVVDDVDAIFNNSDTRNIVWGKIYRADFIRNERFAAGIKFEDKCFNCLLFAKRNILAVSYADAEIYYYRINNISSTMHTTPFIRMLDSVEIILQQLHTQEIVHKSQLAEKAMETFVISRFCTPEPADEEKKQIQKTKENLAHAVNELSGVSMMKKLYWLSLIRFPLIFKVGRYIRKLCRERTTK